MMIVPARPDDRQRAHQALDRLVERRVQRIAGRGGDYDVGRFGQRGGDRRTSELDALRETRPPCRRPTTRRIRRWASITTLTMKSQPAIRPMAVFSSWTGLPARQPLQALGCSRKSGPCHAPTVLQGRQARADQLSPAGETGHQVRLDQTGRDLQLGPDRSVSRPTPAHREDFGPGRCAPRAAARDGSRSGSSRRRAGRPFRPVPLPRWGGANRWPPG